MPDPAPGTATATEDPSARTGRQFATAVYAILLLVAAVGFGINLRLALGPAPAQGDLPEFLRDAPPAHTPGLTAPAALPGGGVPGPAPAQAPAPAGWGHEPEVPWTQADRHVTRTFVVRGTVAEVRQQGDQWVLSYGPGRHSFCVVIPHALGGAWADGPKAHFLHQAILVHGKILMSEGHPTIRLHSAADVSVVASSPRPGERGLWRGEG